MTQEIFGAGFAGLDQKAQLRRAAEEMEAVVLTQMLASMRKSVPEGDLWGKSVGHDVFRSMFDEEIAREAAARSPFGLAEVLVERMEKTVKAGQESPDAQGGPADIPPPKLNPLPRAESAPRSWRI